MDGAGAWQRFRYVTIPQLTPVTSVTLLLGLIYTIRVFDLIQALTQGGPAGGSQTLTTWAYLLSFQQYQFGRGAAVGNLLVVVALIFALLYLRVNRRAEREA
jgi:multiple sugar transport system permease protein